MPDVALIDPAHAKAFEIRKFALDLRTAVSTMDNIDRLQDMEAALIGARHRLKQLGEEVYEAERTRILVVQRIGQLLGPAQRGGDMSPRDEVPPSREVNPADGMNHNSRWQARLLAAYPAVVEGALTSPRVSMARVLSAVRAARTEENAAEAAAMMAAAGPPQLENVQRGQWWALGDHRLYCGDSRDTVFIEACRAAAPTFAFADPSDAGDWVHDYLIDLAPIVAVTPGNRELAVFLRRTTMPYRWTVAGHVTNGMTRGDLGFSNWVPVCVFAREAVSLHRDSQDVLRLAIEPSTSADVAHTGRKPMRLMVKVIELFSAVHDSIVDPFLGSGTTLIAADQLDRRCIGAEVDPVHCGEIVARYGKGARLLST